MKRRKPNLYYRVYGHKPSRKERNDIYDNLLFMAQEHKKYNPADRNDICEGEDSKVVNLDEESTTKTN